MTGAVMTLAGASGGGASGGGALGTLAWADIYGNVVQFNVQQTITGITSPHSLTASITGTGALSYISGFFITAYTGAFNVSAGQTLGWGITNTVAGTTKSGTVTVRDASNGNALVATFNYSVTDN